MNKWVTLVLVLVSSNIAIAGGGYSYDNPGPRDTKPWLTTETIASGSFETPVDAVDINDPEWKLKNEAIARAERIGAANVATHSLKIFSASEIKLRAAEQISAILFSTESSAIAFGHGEPIEIQATNVADPVTIEIMKNSKNNEVLDVKISLWGQNASIENQKIMSEVMAGLQADSKSQVVWVDAASGKKSEIWIGKNSKLGSEQGRVSTIVEVRASEPNQVVTIASEAIASAITQFRAAGIKSTALLKAELRTVERLVKSSKK